MKWEGKYSAFSPPDSKSASSSLYIDDRLTHIDTEKGQVLIHLVHGHASFKRHTCEQTGTGGRAFDKKLMRIEEVSYTFISQVSTTGEIIKSYSSKTKTITEFGGSYDQVLSKSEEVFQSDLDLEVFSEVFQNEVRTVSGFARSHENPAATLFDDDIGLNEIGGAISGVGLASLAAPEAVSKPVGLITTIAGAAISGLGLLIPSPGIEDDFPLERTWIYSGVKEIFSNDPNPGVFKVHQFRQFNDQMD